MKQLDRLPERAIERVLKDAQQEQAELKSFQRLGSASVLTYRVFSNAAHDVQFVSSGSTRKLHRADIEFIADDKTFGGALPLRLEVKSMNTSGAIMRDALKIIRRPVVDGRHIWSVYLTTYGDSGSTRRLKFYFFALGSGTFTVNVLN